MSSDLDPTADPLAPLHDPQFNANAFDDEHGEMYRRLLGQIRGDLEARPGFATLHHMLAERAAHAFVLLKSKDAEQTGTTLHWQDYERINKILLGAIDRLFQEAKLSDADESSKRQIARVFTESLTAIVDDLPLTSTDREKAYARLEARIAELVV